MDFFVEFFFRVSYSRRLRGSISARMDGAFALGANFHTKLLPVKIDGFFLQVRLAMYCCATAYLASGNADLVPPLRAFPAKITYFAHL